MSSTNRVSGTGWRDGELEHLIAWHATTGWGFTNFLALKDWIEKQPSEIRREFMDEGWPLAAARYREDLAGRMAMAAESVAPAVAEGIERQVGNAVDPIAGRLADSGRVEAGWFLRGVADAIDGRPVADGLHEAGGYAAPYRLGWKAAIRL